MEKLRKVANKASESKSEIRFGCFLGNSCLPPKFCCIVTLRSFRRKKGIFGFAVMVVIGAPLLWALPGHDVGSLEQSADTIDQLAS